MNAMKIFHTPVGTSALVVAVVIAGMVFALVWQEGDESGSAARVHIDTYGETDASSAERVTLPPRQPFQNVSKEDLRCLALAIYFEARGESIDGQWAVGDVVLNRVHSKSYPDSVCGVVWQGAPRQGKPDRLFRCQFSFACDGLSDTPRNTTAWEQAMGIAREMLHRGMRGSLHDNVLYYHAEYVSPAWAGAMLQVAQIGKHVFYIDERRRPKKATPG